MAISEAVDWVHSGALGKILYAVGTCYKPRRSIGQLKSPLQIPPTINYDLWCGPAKMEPIFRPRLHYDWHWDFNTGNGDMGNQGVHQMDIARWFLGENELPKRVLSIGGRFGYDDAGNTPNTLVTFFDYQSAPLIFETRGLPRSKEAQAEWGGQSMDSYRGSGVGVLVQCEHGHILVPSSYTQVFAYDRNGVEVKKWVGGGDHFANWLTAVAEKDPSILAANIEEGHVSSALCHIANISYQCGKAAVSSEIAEHVMGNDLLSQSYDRMAGHLRANGESLEAIESSKVRLGCDLQLDPQGNEVIGNEQATAMLSRDYRYPYELPGLS